VSAGFCWTRGDSLTVVDQAQTLAILAASEADCSARRRVVPCVGVYVVDSSTVVHPTRVLSLTPSRLLLPAVGWYGEQVYV